MSSASARASTERLRARGGRVVNVRIGPAALTTLETLKAAHACTLQDVIEGLLLGNIRPNPERLSAAEIDAARALGVSL